jgi:glycosyltransferase involved in cell wall biosynthesis
MTRAGKVRVLHVITRLIRGGADENTVFTVEGVDREHYDSEILAGCRTEIDGFSPEIRNRTRVLPELVRDPHPIKDIIALIKMVLIIKRGRYDIVHTHTAKAGFLGRVAARIAGVPHVVHTVHGVTFHEHVNPVLRRLYVLLERVAARLCEVMITVGEDVKRKYLAEAIGRRDQYVTIPSGIDLTPFDRVRANPDGTRNALRRELGFDPDDVVVGVVSRLEPRKGHQYLIEAIARLAPDFPRLKVLVVGEGPDRGALLERVRSSGLADRFTFAGYRADIASVISTFDVAVLTSLWEGLPRVLVQYALLEKATVTFDVEGAREIVEDGFSGWIVERQDVDELADRLRRLTVNPEEREALGRRARQRVEQHWNVDLMVERISNLYDDVGAGRAVGEVVAV